MEINENNLNKNKIWWRWNLKNQKYFYWTRCMCVVLTCNSFYLIRIHYLYYIYKNYWNVAVSQREEKKSKNIKIGKISPKLWTVKTWCTVRMCKNEKFHNFHNKLYYYWLAHSFDVTVDHHKFFFISSAHSLALHFCFHRV